MSKSPTDSPPEKQPSSGVRTLVTGLILFHLFALFVVFTSNGASSGLQRRFRRLTFVTSYMQLLDLDRHFRYFMIYGNLEDRGYRIEADYKLAGDAESHSLPIFEETLEGAWIRKERNQYLARLTVTIDEQTQGVLAQGLANGLVGWLKQQGIQPSKVQELNLRIRAHDMRNRDAVAARMDPNADSFFQTVYQARIVPRDNAPPLLIKIVAAGEAAPASAGGESNP